MGEDGRQSRGAEIRVGQERRRHVGDERQRQPLEDAKDGLVGGEQLQRQDQRGGRRNQPDGWHEPPPQQRSAGGDGAQVGAGVDGVGRQQGEYRGSNHPGWELAAKAQPKAHAGVEGDPAAELLDGSHQGKREQRRPEQPVTELAPHLRVGADPARVVVAGAGDEPGAQYPKQRPWVPSELPGSGEGCV